MNLSVDEQIYRIAKSKLCSADGVGFSEFKRSLTPRYFIVWRDIFFGYLALTALVVSVALIQRMAGPWLIAVALVFAALLFGFTFAYLNLFFHEAAHRNLAADARWSDLLADWLVGIFFGQSIEAYRIVHFGHHQYHGTPMDTEHSYFDPLNMRFIVGALFGVRAFQVARKRETVANSDKRASRCAVLRGLALNGALVFSSFFSGYWSVSLAWTAGMLSFYPFFNAMRQLLEHRDDLASDHADYHKLAHGRINRLFGDSLLALTLGGAGFNRHLLHHWEPQISYTRLRELESFVMSCDCAPLFRQKQTTYTRTFFHFLRWSRR